MKGLSREQRKRLRDEIVEYRKKGHLVRECCEHFGVKDSYVYMACRGISFNWRYDVESMVAASRRQRKKRADEQTAIRMIGRKTPQFEYISGYSGDGCFIYLKCKICGKTTRKSYESIKHGCARCENCYAEELKLQREQRIEDKKKEKLRQKRLGKEYAQMQMKVCPTCGRVFIGGKVYCSAKCRRHNKWMLKDGYRDLFPLEEVYAKDNGVCYICGRQCDWNDYTIKNGVKIYGNGYPSRDHVVPKSKGGANEWENIRLACRYCNSVKGDRPLSKIG